MISSILVFQLGQARVWFAMSRDGLLPTVFSHIHPKFRTPAVATWVAGFVVGVPAGLLDIGTVSNLSNIGTLFAFVLVSIAVLILRLREPERHRSFRVPLGPLFPVLSIIFCVVLMMGLEVMTWMAFFAWLVTGLLILFPLQPPSLGVRWAVALSQVSKPRHFDCAQGGLCDTSMLCLVKCPGKVGHWAPQPLRGFKDSICRINPIS